MKLSLWRYLHLIVAIITSIFLIIASVTGIILAIDAIDDQIPNYKSSDFEQTNIAQLIATLQEQYLEIYKIETDHRGFVSIEAIDNQGEEIKGYIDINSGKILAPTDKKSALIQWVTSLHRSLFLHETGRMMMGIVSALLCIIALSGIALIVKRQQGFRRFFSKIIQEKWHTYYHVILGRWSLLLIFIIALTGTYLSMMRFVFAPQTTDDSFDFQEDIISKNVPITDFPIFQKTLIKEVKSIEFPFSEDQDEFFLLKLKNKELIVSQFSGRILHEFPYGIKKQFAEIALNLHTGRTHIFWAILLMGACMGILFFIYSGFAITWARKSTRIQNPFDPNHAEYIILFGSENASTLHFANAIHKQLLYLGQKSFLTELNAYRKFEKAQHILIFTSTYGLGQAPCNATNFLYLLEKHPQPFQVNVWVIGFGASVYPDFCQYAKDVYTALQNQPWANLSSELHTIDHQSINDFMQWIKKWNHTSEIQFSTQQALYEKVVPKLQKMKVVSKTEIDQENVFSLSFKVNKKFCSGDLLAIYPQGQERLYSIAKINHELQLVVKKHHNGLGSGCLHSLKVGDSLQARIITNPRFHLPQKRNIIFIANGTGIAPFLGMMQQVKSDCRLYAGFRQKTTLTQIYLSYFETLLQKNKLTQYQVAYSQQEEKQHVTHLLEKDASFLADFLQKGGICMLCGSLAMSQDVEQLFHKICLTTHQHTLDVYKAKGQWLTDCY